MLTTIDEMVTPARVRMVAAILLAINLTITAGSLVMTHHLIDAFHQPLGGDFIIFYGASNLTLHGQAAQAFDPQALLVVQRAVLPGVPEGLRWCYPPPYQLLIAPLALLPFPLAYAVFIGVTLAAFAWMVQTIYPGRLTLLMIGAFPGTFVNIWDGQNGFLTAALLGFGLTALDRRPWLAGAMLGLLVYKPQFGILLPILLIGTGRWRSTLAAALSGGAFIAASALILGTAPWIAFLHTLPVVSTELAAGQLPWSRVPSLFVAARYLGAPAPAAYALQAVVAAIVAVTTLLAWRRPGPLALKAGLAVLATFLVTPYSFNYDLVLLAVPIAAIAWYGRDHALPSGTMAMLLLAAMTPNLFLNIAKITHLQLMTAVVVAFYGWLFMMLWRPAPALQPDATAPDVEAVAAPARS